MKANKKRHAEHSGLDQAEWQRRFAGLTPAAIGMVEAASTAIERRRTVEARRSLAGALALAPRHPEVLRLLGVLCHLEGRFDESVATLRDALDLRPGDALILNNLGSSLRASGDFDGALAAFEEATRLAPQLAGAWFNLGKTLKVRARTEEARRALEQAIRCSPGHVRARIVLGDTLKALGETQAAAESYREALRLNPRAGQAWFSLANLKTLRFDATDAARLANLAASPDLAEEDRISIGFARVKALDDIGKYEQAFAALVDANARKRRLVHWDAPTFSRQVDAILAAFPQASCVPAGSTRGREVIFVVSLPRSGSTLTEQILAAHSQVEGASELPDLPAVIEGESRRRGVAFPGWVGTATDGDWARLGEEYLERTGRWTADRPRFTDKGLSNWQYVGAALAMLPAARVVVCRRDPVETCLSCFHQLFAQGQEYSYTLAELAAYWRDFDRLCTHWTRIDPGRVADMVYEALLERPEATTSRLLEFCGLEFESSCLRFHEATRAVRTASAAQVREPLRRDTARAAHYGPALDTLKVALGVR
ncbi:tetratricopeptide repeat-containing sulfotransferase family protein [Dokdonella immobilis]|uniref:Tetratricopeptide repeat-containing protein n=1 Tax=Dokdonella immobilis TaxID=578942 RepID=A0A1I4V5F2_9GAMM|nr:sulfotransferase [Dokdonella immobilis]SFM96457.1 Tetratricopeptide repeat-containing protein [Dokdonella immobilis]